MHSILNVREIETMSSCSWNTEKSSNWNQKVESMSSSDNSRSAMLCENRIKSPNPQNDFSNTKYPIKTLCFSRKSSTMPTKEEYSLLLTCGLGARKWQVSLDFDEAAFRNSIYKIYPRLNSVSAYTLWNIKKDKTFEKLPAKVNTPRSIRAYLGNQFSGCLIIMPSEEIQLFDHQLQFVKNKSCQNVTNCNQQSNQNSERQLSQMTKLTDELRFHNKPEKRLRFMVPDSMEQNEVRSANCSENESKIYSGTALSSLQISQQDPVSLKRDHTGTGSNVPYHFSPPNHREPKHQSNSRSLPRAFCLVCGKVPKQPNASPFYHVDTSTLPTGNSEKAFTCLSKKLREVIKIPDPQRNQLVPSKEVCKKCFRQLVDIDFMENQIKRVKEEMMGNFLSTVTKVSKMSGSMSPLNPVPNTYTSRPENTYTTTTNTIRSSASIFSSPHTSNLDESIRQNVNSIINHHNNYSTSSSRSITSLTNSNPWESAPQPRQVQARKPTNERQQSSDDSGYRGAQRQSSTPYENIMLLNNERVLNRGRRFGQQNVSTMNSRSASHDPAGSSSLMFPNQPNVQYPEIPSVPSSNNGDAGTASMADTYQIYRRARSSPPRITDIPTVYYTNFEKMEGNNEYQEEYNKNAPVNLSSNSSSGNEVPACSTMNLASVSADRCSDWVKDSRACAQKNELIKDNHYSIKDALSQNKNGEFTGTEQTNMFAAGTSSGEDSTVASCGSTPPMTGRNDAIDANDYQKNSSDTSSDKGEKRESKKDQHKRAHHQDHKLCGKNMKQHKKQNRRLQRSPMKLVQGKQTGFQKPVKSKKLKSAKQHNKEAFDAKKEENSRNNGNGNSDSNGTSDSNLDNNGNGPSEWTRSSSNTPSPPTSFGSVGSNENSSSDPSSNDTHQQMSTHFPKPFWKKRYCEDSSESSTQQTQDNLKPTDVEKVKSEDNDPNNSSSNSAEETDESQSKRRKIERCSDEGTDSDKGNDSSDVGVTDYPTSHLNEDINKIRNKNNERRRSNDSSPRILNHNETSNMISTDSGHESRGSD